MTARGATTTRSGAARAATGTDAGKRRTTRRPRRSFGYIRALPSGRIQASYVGPDLVRYTAPHTFDTKIDAEGFLAAERRLIDRDDWIPPQRRIEQRAAATMTFMTFAETWIAERDLAPKTRVLYRRLLDSRILPALGNEILADITPALIRTWWSALGKDGTPTSAAHAYATAKTILGTAVDDGLIATNPCQVKGAGRPPKRRELDLLTLPELATVTAAMPERYRTAVPVTAWCGLRFGEMIELRRKDVVNGVDGMVLRVRRSATIVGNDLVVGTPKTDAGIRDIHVPPHVAAMLSTHMRRFTGPGPDAFAFTTTRGKRLSASAFTKTFKLALATIGKEHVRVHDLRHVGAVLAAQSGATTKELMQRLGHTTPEMSMRYQHVAAGRDAEIARRLSALAGE